MRPMDSRFLKGVVFSATVLASGLAQASYVSEVEQNNSYAEAQSLNGYFSLNADANIQNSTSIAHASVNGTGDGSWDYYSFLLDGLSSVLLDIDSGMPEMDAYLNVYNESYAPVAQNDDSQAVDAGSVHRYDSFLALTLDAGLYYVRVGRCCVTAPTSGQDYTLHVSATHPAPVPLPAAAPLMLSGVGVLGALLRRRRADSIAA